MQQLKGTAMTELVDGGRLKRADILLTHSRRSYWGWLIRLGTRCYWNHALILFSVRGQGYSQALIIDPRMGAIHLNNISHYFDRPDRYDVAVKRLDEEWFQNDSDIGGPSYYRTVCEIALGETTDKVDARFKRVSRGILRQVRISFRFIRRKIKYPGQRRKRLSSIAQRLKISAYGCGGFVQWCYYEGVSQVLGKSEDRARLEEVIFNPRIGEPVIQRELLSTTPADLAGSDKLSWKYVIRNGAVWEVSSKEEVKSILDLGKKIRAH